METYGSIIKQEHQPVQEVQWFLSQELVRLAKHISAGQTLLQDLNGQGRKFLKNYTHQLFGRKELLLGRESVDAYTC